MISISRKILGSEHDLVYENGFSWGNIPRDELNLGPGQNSIIPLLNIFGSPEYSFVDKKYLRMASILGLKKPSFYKLIGKNHLKNIKKTIDQLLPTIERIKSSRYLEYYQKTQNFLYSLKKVEADKLRLASLVAMKTNYKDIKFSNGHILPPKYHRDKTKTGRLTVSSGIPILTMKKEHRNIMKARQLDYSAMEPRLLLALSGKYIEGDLYEWVASQLSINKDRSYAKIAVISSMYGSKMVPEITELFGLNVWIDQLEQSVQEGTLESYWGRPIIVGNTKGHKLLALWLQSSAVDAALLGFANLFKERKDLIPHCVIHDACIFNGINVPKYINIDKNIKLPIECTEL
tara:strand:+ start:1653 stop:2693 length:1041 start_codon:yes stop_codon:yes gene_type:complete